MLLKKPKLPTNIFSKLKSILEHYNYREKGEGLRNIKNSDK